MKSPDGAGMRPAAGRGSWRRRAGVRVTLVLVAVAAIAAPWAVSAEAGAGHPVDALATAYGPGAPIDFPVVEAWCRPLTISARTIR